MNVEQLRESHEARMASGFEPDDATAQDVIDALRMALMAQKDTAEALKIVNLLVEYAPETDSNRGIDLLLHLITESALKVSLTP